MMKNKLLLFLISLIGFCTVSSCSNFNKTLSTDSTKVTSKEDTEEHNPDEIQSISAAKYVTNYKYGDEIEYSKSQIMATYYDGSTKDITADCKFSPITGTKLIVCGQQTVSVLHSSSGFECEYKIFVDSSDLKEIKVSNSKTKYCKGEYLNLNNIIVFGIYSNDITKNITSECVFEIGDTQSTRFMEEGEQTVKVTHRNSNLRSSFDVTVNPAKFTTLDFSLCKSIYYIGDTFSYDGLTINACYTDDQKVDVTSSCSLNIEDGKVFDKERSYEVIVTYLNKNYSYTIDVKQGTILSVSVLTTPTKTRYLVGVDTFNPSGLVLKVTYSDASTAQVTSGYTLSYATGYTFTSSDVGIKSVKVSYSDGKGYSFTTFNIVVYADYQITLTNSTYAWNKGKIELTSCPTSIRSTTSSFTVTLLQHRTGVQNYRLKTATFNLFAYYIASYDSSGSPIKESVKISTFTYNYSTDESKYYDTSSSYYEYYNETCNTYHNYYHFTLTINNDEFYEHNFISASLSYDGTEI